MSKKNSEVCLKDYHDCYSVMSALYDEVDGVSFYQEIFPNNENTYENTKVDLVSKNKKYVPNAIYLYKNKSEDKSFRRRIMLDDTWSEDYYEFVYDKPTTLCGGLSYIGRANKLVNARYCNALIFDLDDVGRIELECLLDSFSKKTHEYMYLPTPTFVTLSGTGLHLYYVFSKPIEMFPYLREQMKQLKYYMTEKLWEPGYTTKNENVQFQGLNQGFRMVGSINDKYGTRVIGFRTGEKIDISYLNDFADKHHKVDTEKRFIETVKMAEAKEKWPDWYQRVIIERNTEAKHWIVKEDLYNWWLGKIKEAKPGHRYYYMMALAIYADKCNIPKDRLKEDLEESFIDLKKIKHKNKLTEEDMKAALESYRTGYHTASIDFISRKTGITIIKNKRNYRKQEDHMKVMRAIQEVLYPDWREGNGRKTKESLVVEWRKKNPTKNKAQCAKELGISRNTAAKWWNG